MKNIENADTRQRILDTAIAMFAKECRLQGTTRELAARAKVNLASLNYYFRTKNKLIEEVEIIVSQQIEDICQILSDTMIPPYKRLFDWGYQMMTYLLENPGIVYLWAEKRIHTKASNENALRLIQDNENNLMSSLSMLSSEKDTEKLKYKAVQFFSCIIHPVIMEIGMKDNIAIAIQDEHVRKKYIETIVSQLAIKS
ncbi:TetR/AcrR family transcriptional regulator [bacterium]|nr:TetR/AcrR family transcriptional regulator [bacterium]